MLLLRNEPVSLADPFSIARYRDLSFLFARFPRQLDFQKVGLLVSNLAGGQSDPIPKSAAGLTECYCDFFRRLGTVDSQFDSEPSFPGGVHRLGFHTALSRLAVAPQICSDSESACTLGRCSPFFATGLFQNTIFRMGLDLTNDTLRVFALVFGGEAVRQKSEDREASQWSAPSVVLAPAIRSRLRDRGINR